MTKAIAVPIIVGEVLWDCLIDSPTGRISQRILGGAPLNVAWNLAGFGLNPIFISAIGDDELGHEIVQTMTDWGLTCQGVSVAPGLATGRVQVTLVDGEPTYEITQGVAYDAIPSPSNELLSLIEQRCGQLVDAGAKSDRGNSPVSRHRRLLYHGSLAYRDERSRGTIDRLRDNADQAVFFDVNLRPPHYQQDWLSKLLPGSQIVKLNQDELHKVTSLPVSTASEIEQAASVLLERLVSKEPGSPDPFGRGSVLALVTLGADGAIAFTPELPCGIRVQAPTPEKFVDAVGAGDAFASVVLHGLLTQREPADYLRDAVRFASRVCGLSGATTDDPNFYQSFLTSERK